MGVGLLGYLLLTDTKQPEGWVSLNGQMESALSSMSPKKEGNAKEVHTPAIPQKVDQGTKESSSHMVVIDNTKKQTDKVPNKENGQAEPSVTTVQAELLVDLNQATLTELDTLPGIGESKAKAIIAYRESKGNFQTIDEIQEVKGIGPKMFSKLKSKITVASAAVQN